MSLNQILSNENTRSQIEQDNNSNNNNIESGMKTVRLNSSTANYALPNIITSTTSNLNQQNQQTNTSNNEAPSGSGLVRRLSVTARPGDIFYKVKDVTESSSTTDTVTNEPNKTNTENIEQEIIIKPSTNTQINTNTIRKTTTWNVKRHQTTSITDTKTANEANSKPNVTSKDDSLTTSDLNKNSAEPGSPLFARELLSIR